MGVQVPLTKGQFWGEKHYLHGECLAERATSTTLLQQNPSFGGMPDRVHFSCTKLCWKVTKYDVHIFWLTVSVYILLECPSYLILLSEWSSFYYAAVIFLFLAYFLPGGVISIFCCPPLQRYLLALAVQMLCIEQICTAVPWDIHRGRSSAGENHS